jgi:hydrogenase expression/formation protein HypC
MCLGVPGKVIDVFDRDGIRMGTVDFGGIRREACLAFEPEVVVGSYVVIHVGFAISVVDEEEAARSYALLAEMDNLENIDLPQDPDGVRGPQGASAHARAVGPRQDGVRA